MADEFTQELLSQVSGGPSARLSQKTGIPEDKIMTALAGLSPVLLGGLKRKQEACGAEGVESFMAQHGASEQKAEHLEATVEEEFEGQAQGSPAISSLLGSDQEEQTVNALSQKSGIEPGMLKKLLPVLAPIVMSMLMKKGQSHSGTPTRSGGIGAILDRDGDGQILDDIAGMAFRHFSGNSGGGGGGILGSVLGSLTKGK